MLMLGLLHVLCLLLAWYAFYIYMPGLTGREAVLFASVIWAAVIVLSVELLSLFNMFAFSPVLVFWVLMTAAVVVFIVRSKARRRLLPNRMPMFSVVELMCASMIFFIVVAVGITALSAPPNNWDSLTYHMSRVAHWVQNRTVCHYPTTMARQNFFPPGSEYIIAQFQILSASDRFANLVQWLAMAGCLIGVSVITMHLNGSRLPQIFASLVACCIPMGILQASGTQNDYLEAFWLVCFMCFLLRHKVPSLTEVIGLGCSLGLGVLTKGTGYGYFVPMILWLLYRIRPVDKQILLRAVAVFLIAFLLNAGYYARNVRTAGSPLGSRAMLSMHANEAVTPAILLSNIIRNIGLHFGTSIDGLNRWEERQIYNLHKLMGIDIRDSRSTFGGHEFHIPVSLHEDTAGNFFHLLLIVLAIVLFGFRKKRGSLLGQYFFVIAFAFLMFNITVKWMPFNSRLHLPVFVLFSPFVAIVLSDIPCRSSAIIFTAVCLLANAIPPVFRNNTRRLVSSKKATVFNTPRIAQYFNNDTTRMSAYIDAADYVKGCACKDVGLIIPDDYWEYPFWVLLKGGNSKVSRIEHVFINGGASSQVKRYPLGDFNPCMVIAVNMIFDSKITLNGGIAYREVFEKGNIKVYQLSGSSSIKIP